MAKYNSLNPRTELEQTITADLQATIGKHHKFKITHNGTIASSAPGGKTDIVCESAKNVIIVEVTQLVNSAQAKSEATPVISHLESVKKEYGKPTFCFFISPKTHYRTSNLFRLHNYNSIKEGKKDLRIFSMNFDSFEFLINELKENGTRYKEKDLLKLFEKVLYVSKDSDSLAIVNELIGDTAVAAKLKVIKAEELLELEASLLKTFKKIHDVLWSVSGKEPQAAFNEFSKILFIKIQEQLREQTGKENRFTRAWINTAIEDYDTDNPINDIVFNEYVKTFSKENFFDADEKLLLSNEVIVKLLGFLEPYTFIDPVLDIKGKVYEHFLASQLKGEKLGQYFTPREIITFVMDVLKPGEEDVILDPFCGTARFLLEAMKRIEEGLKLKYTGEALKKKLETLYTEKLIGFDNSEIISKTAKKNMFLNGDGRTGIKNLNTFNHFVKTNASIIATNPPFGKTSELETIFGKFAENKATFDKYPLLKVGHREYKSGIIKDFLQSGKSSTQILAIQQYVRYIGKNGRIITVIDDGVLNTSSYSEVRNYIKDHFFINAVFSLPVETFQPYTPTKTSLLFLTRKESTEVQTFPVFFGYAEKVGKDSTNRPCRNDLPFIHSQFELFVKDKSSYKTAEKYRSFCFKVDFDKIEDRLDFVYYDPRLLKKIQFLLDSFKLLEPKGYRLETLQSIWVDSKTGKTPAKKVYLAEEELDDIENENKIPILKVKSLTNDSINWNNIGWVPIDYKTSCPTLLDNDILLTSSAHNIDYIAKKVDIIDFKELPSELEFFKSVFIFVGELLYIRPNPEKINPLYLLYFLRSELAYAQIKRCITGQSAHLYPEDIADKVLVLIPPDSGKSFATRIAKTRGEIDNLKASITKVKTELLDDFEKLLTPNS